MCLLEGYFASFPGPTIIRSPPTSHIITVVYWQVLDFGSRLFFVMIFLKCFGINNGSGQLSIVLQGLERWDLNIDIDKSNSTYS